GVDKFYEENNTIKPFSNSNNIKAPINQYKEQLLLGKILPIGICFNKKLLYQHVDFDGYFNMKITIEDYPILVDLAMNTNIYKVNEVLHVYRIHHDSYSNKKTFESHAFLNLQMKNLFDFFNKKYEFPKDIIQKFNNNYYKQLLFLAGYFEKKEVGKKAFNKIKTKSIKDY
ncbi:hypothetical protein, partial [Arcobacter sp.]|uniref:hypothetical protein n=1 Tax=Arcobacter sp. TaxID=1872629 RepID=UPI003D1032A8